MAGRKLARVVRFILFLPFHFHKLKPIITIMNKFKFLVVCFTLCFVFMSYRSWNHFLWVLNYMDPPHEQKVYWKDRAAPRLRHTEGKHLRGMGVQKISSILENMAVHYPNYVWFHTGWMQDLDVGYDADQWDSHPLIVHVIPFSHADPGWLSNYDVNFARSKYVLDVVLRKMTSHRNLTFVWSEVCYLKKWYEMIGSKERNIFKKLLKEKRFEVLTGGMVMPDEAIVPYYSLLNVLTEGHLWLKKEFNYSVNTAWSLDSFGHSSTYAYLLRSAGIERTFIQRTHYALKKHLAFKKQIEFYWTQSWDESATATRIFTHMSPFVLYSLLYSCGPDIPVCCKFEFTKSRCWQYAKYHRADAITDENLRSRSLALLDQLRKKVQFVEHNHALLLVGDDFSYENDVEWANQWDNMEKLFKYLNENKDLKVQVQYSTMEEYLRSAEQSMKDSNLDIPIFAGDFFPYSDRSNQYWSGFYSSRPHLKSLIRTSQSHLRSAEIFLGLVSLRIRGRKLEKFLLDCHDRLSRLREEFALYQHHDTITGTSRSNVMKQTVDKLSAFLVSVRTLFSDLATLVVKETDKVKQNLFETLVEETGYDPHRPTVSVPRTLVLFNSLARRRVDVVKLHVDRKKVRAEDVSGNKLKCQIDPVFDREFRLNENSFQLTVEVVLKPLSLFVIRISEPLRTSDGCFGASVWTNFNLNNTESSSLISQDSVKMQSFVIANNILKVYFNMGIMKEIVRKSDNARCRAEMKFASYSSNSWLKPLSDKSGAYIFLPNGKSSEVLSKMRKLILVEGMLRTYVVTETSGEVQQIVELFNTSFLEQGVHVKNFVDIRSKSNFELSMVLQTCIKNKHFFTDLNGYQVERRTRHMKFPLQGNFYPMTNMIFVEDSGQRLTLASAQCHAASSIKRGEIEVMLDRRLLQDDWRGLNEGLTDNVPISSAFTIVWETSEQHINTNEPSMLAQDSAARLDNPLVLLHQLDGSSALNAVADDLEPLPCGIHLVSWRVLSMSLRGQQILVTLHHNGLDSGVQEKSRDPSCSSKAVNVTTSMVVGRQNVSELFEMNLSGTRIKSKESTNTLKIKQKEIKTWLIIVDFKNS